VQPVRVPAPRPWLVTSGQQAPPTVERLLRSLPEWFGVESSVVDYVASAARLPTYLAWPAGEQDAPGAQRDAVGALLAARHFPAAAEIYLMAVDPAMHRCGVGRALVEALERDLARDGVRLLQVKTLGPSDSDTGYRRTRLFYQAMGFEPLEEITGLWPDNPCLIMVKTLALPGNVERTIDAGHDGNVQRGERPGPQDEAGQASLSGRGLRVDRA
jgi:GNAT superfamily N-acetyltransferase